MSKLKIAVLVSGGGTNLQAIMDAIDSGTITNAEISVVISNNANAYALERAKMHGIEAKCVSPKAYETREKFNEALLQTIQSYGVDLVVLAGCLVVIPEIMVKAYPNKIINIHPALIPSSCRFSGSDSAGNDRQIPQPDHQYSSFPDSLFLRNGLLWIEGS